MATPRTTMARLLVVCLLFAFAVESHAWTPASQRRIAEEAARLVPPDLYRQLRRHRDVYLQGATDPFSDNEEAHHFKNSDGTGLLDQVILKVTDDAIQAIRAPRSFHEISWRLGVVSHYLADAYNPLNSDQTDREEARYFSDFLHYLQAVEPRVRMVFYGFRPGFNGRQHLPQLLQETLTRSRELYPLVGREYRRIGFKSGVAAFDDRSTAYGVASLAHSHAVSDIAEVLRYIWIEAGGIDTRTRIPLRGQQVLRVPQTSAPR